MKIKADEASKTLCLIKTMGTVWDYGHGYKGLMFLFQQVKEVGCWQDCM
jgi:hypothetical protein